MTPDLNQKTTQTDEASPPPKSSKLDLSITKILGGALAAMTAAALGSRLSVAGTIIGAALASVIAAVASSIYTASLKHTQDKVRTVWTGRTGHGADSAGVAASSSEPMTVEERSGDQPRTVNWAPTQPLAPRPATTKAAKPADQRGLSWKSILVGTLAAFGIAAAVLTGFELISGHALSGGDGTTITQVSEPRQPTTKPSGAASKSASPTASPSSTAPSSTATTAPSSEPSTSSAPTPGTTPSAPEPSASASASGSATPSTAGQAGQGAQSTPSP